MSLHIVVKTFSLFSVGMITSFTEGLRMNKHNQMYAANVTDAQRAIIMQERRQQMQQEMKKKKLRMDQAHNNKTVKLFLELGATENAQTIFDLQDKLKNAQDANEKDIIVRDMFEILGSDVRDMFATLEDTRDFRQLRENRFLSTFSVLSKLTKALNTFRALRIEILKATTEDIFADNGGFRKFLKKLYTDSWEVLGSKLLYTDSLVKEAQRSSILEELKTNFDSFRKEVYDMEKEKTIVMDNGEKFNQSDYYDPISKEIFQEGQSVCWLHVREGQSVFRSTERLLEKSVLKFCEDRKTSVTFDHGSADNCDCETTLENCDRFVHPLVKDEGELPVFKELARRQQETSWVLYGREIPEEKKAKFLRGVGICVFLTICTLMACRALCCSNGGCSNDGCALWGEEHWSRHGGWEWRMVQIGSGVVALLTVCFIIFVLMQMIMYIYVMMHVRSASWCPEIDFQALGFF